MALALMALSARHAAATPPAPPQEDAREHATATVTATATADAGAPDGPPAPAPGAASFATGSYLAGPGGVVRAAGFTLTAAGLLAGVSALVAVEVKSGQLAVQSAKLGPDTTICDAPSGADVAPCERFEAGLAARDRTRAAAGVLFAGAGVAAAVTLLSFFLLPPARPSGAKLGGLDFTLSPLAGPQGGGVSLEASW